MTENKQTKTNWKPTDKRFVGFLDILGFKDMVARNSHSEIYTKLGEISNIKSFLENINQEIKEEQKILDAEIYIVSFSDSIVVFSKNDTPANLKYFVVAIRWLMAKTIENGTPLKGAIAHGEISLNKSEQIYFGQPIIDAYQVEGDVNYLGVVCHNTIDKYISENEEIIKESTGMEYLSQVIKEFKTPLKSGRTFHYNIMWGRAIEHSVDKDDEDAEIKIESTRKEKANEMITAFRKSASGSPRNYIDNTIDILDELIKI